MWNFPFALFPCIQKNTHTLAWISRLITNKYPNKWAHFKTTKSVQKFSLLENVWKILWNFPFIEALLLFSFPRFCSFEGLPKNSVNKVAKMLLLIILKNLLPLLLNKRSSIHGKVLSFTWTWIRILNYKSLVLVNLFCENMVRWQLGDLKCRRNTKRGLVCTLRSVKPRKLGSVQPGSHKDCYENLATSLSPSFLTCL